MFCSGQETMRLLPSCDNAGGICEVHASTGAAWRPGILLGAELNAEIGLQTAEDSAEGGRKPLGARNTSVATMIGAAKACGSRHGWTAASQRDIRAST